MEHQSTHLDKAMKISIIAGALIVALSLAYYLVIFLPKKEATRIDQQKQDQEQQQQAKADAIKKVEDEKIANRKSLNLCLSMADISYSSFWDSECKGQGLRPDCTLPEYNADRVEKSKKDDKDACFRRYPQN